MKDWWSLSPEEKKTRSKRCAVGSAVIALVFAVIFGINIYNANVIKSKCTEVTTGEVISVNPANWRRPQSTLTATYYVNGASYFTEGHYSSGFSVADTWSSKPVVVHYSPEDPSVSYAADGPDTSACWILGAFVGLFLIGGLLFLLQAKRTGNNGGM